MSTLILYILLNAPILQFNYEIILFILFKMKRFYTFFKKDHAFIVVQKKKKNRDNQLR